MIVDAETINVVVVIFAGAASFIAGLLVGAWRVSARVSAYIHRLDDHERRLGEMERCVSATFTRLHDRIDDLMLLVGADPDKFRKERRADGGSEFRGARDL